jgi:Calcineurin-like phosphoesterase
MSIKPIAVMTADTHLATRAWAKHPGLTGDSYYGLQQVADYCHQHHLPLFLAGDVFDKTRPDPATIWQIKQTIDRLNKVSSIYFIQGQHELDRHMPWLKAIDSATIHMHKIHIKVKGVCFYGLDWTPADTIKTELNNIDPTVDVFVAHQVWRDFMGSKIGEAECAFEDIPHAKVLFTGDFHRTVSQLSRNKTDQMMRVISPGTLCMQAIDENPAKWFFVLHDDLSFIQVPLKTRNCFRINIMNKKELEIFLKGNIEQLITPQDGVPPDIAKNIAHITYREDIPEVYTRITHAIDNKAHLFLVPVRSETEIISVESTKRRLRAEGGLKACLDLVVDKDTDSYRDLVTLLDSLDPSTDLEVIHNMRKEQQYARNSLQDPGNEQ